MNNVVNFVKMEFFKIKTERTFLISIILAILIPLLLGLVSIFFRKEIGSEFSSLMDLNVSLFVGTILVLIAAVIINSLFSIDLKTHTLKILTPLHLSKGKYIIAKFITLLIWLIILSILNWLFSIIILAACGATGIETNIMFKTLKQVIFAGILTFSVMTPIAFVYIVTKNSNATLILTIFLSFAPLLIGPFIGKAGDVLNYLPWTFLSALVTGTAPEIGYNSAWAIVIVTFIAGFGLSYYYFCKKDVSL